MATPASRLAKRLAYGARQLGLPQPAWSSGSRWNGLTYFLDDGRMEIDSNVVDAFRMNGPSTCSRKRDTGNSPSETGDQMPPDDVESETQRLMPPPESPHSARSSAVLA